MSKRNNLLVKHVQRVTHYDNYNARTYVSELQLPAELVANYVR